MSYVSVQLESASALHVLANGVSRGSGPAAIQFHSVRPASRGRAVLHDGFGQLGDKLGKFGVAVRQRTADAASLNPPHPCAGNMLSEVLAEGVSCQSSR